MDVTEGDTRRPKAWFDASERAVVPQYSQQVAALPKHWNPDCCVICVRKHRIADGLDGGCRWERN